MPSHPSDTLMCLGFASVALQILGYIVYIFKSLKRDLEPNPTTWFMFAYGTFILTMLEWDRGANWTLLLLPGSCAILAVLVAFMCWKRGTLKWPKKTSDRVSFLADVFLTICYIGAWILLKTGFLSEQGRESANLVFLIGSNLTTLTSFYPLLRETKNDPELEKALPWTIWTTAYIALGIVTYMNSGFWTELMIYPVMNAILHGSVAWLSRANRRVHFKTVFSR